jgi:hypothetical protein
MGKVPSQVPIVQYMLNDSPNEQTSFDETINLVGEIIKQKCTKMWIFFNKQTNQETNSTFNLVSIRLFVNLVQETLPCLK